MSTNNLKITNKYLSARMIACVMVDELDESQVVESLLTMTPILSWTDEDILLELEGRNILNHAIEFGYVETLSSAEDLVLVDRWQSASLIANDLSQSYNKLLNYEPATERELILKWDDQTILQELKDRNLLDKAIERKFVFVSKSV